MKITVFGGRSSMGSGQLNAVVRHIRRLAGAPAAVPAALAASTLRAAVLLLPGKMVATGVVSAGAAALVKGALNSFLIAKVKIGVVFLLAANVLGLGLGSVVHQVLAQPHSAIPAGSSTKAEERKELVIT